MADRHIALTEADLRVLKGMIDREKRQQVNAPATLITDRFDQGEDHQAPEVYVAYPNTYEGIPARDGDEPGEADCTIYAIYGTPPTLEEITSLEQTVYNLQEAALSQSYIPIGRDKYGKWIALVGSSGSASCNRVRFQILTSDSLTRTALCAIVSRPYGCSESDIPGTVIDGAAVEVCDPSGCFFNDPNDLLTNREGWAEYMMPVSGSTFCQDGSYYLVPEWQVYSLCCATDTCNL